MINLPLLIKRLSRNVGEDRCERNTNTERILRTSSINIDVFFLQQTGLVILIIRLQGSYNYKGIFSSHKIKSPLRKTGYIHGAVQS